MCLQVSADRWWCVHKPINYRVRQSKTLAARLLTATWLLTLLLHLPLTGLYDVISSLWPSGTALQDKAGKSVSCGGQADPDLCVRHARGAGDVAVTCDVPYGRNVVVVVVVTALRYVAPFLFLLGLNVTLYSKISDRKRLQVRRSISGVDTVLFSLLKASSWDWNCPNEDNNNDLRRASRTDRRLSRLSPAPLNRRHTMSQILFPGLSSSPPLPLAHRSRYRRR